MSLYIVLYCIMCSKCCQKANIALLCSQNAIMFVSVDPLGKIILKELSKVLYLTA